MPSACSLWRSVAPVRGRSPRNQRPDLYSRRSSPGDSKIEGQEPGAGYQIPLPWGTNESTCVVTALRRWLDVLRGQFGPQVSGPLFRAASVSGRISRCGLNKDSVDWLIKNLTQKAGLDPDPLRAHSCRSGHITQAIRSRVPEAIVMLQSRHKNVAVFRKYVRRGKLFAHTSATALGM